MGPVSGGPVRLTFFTPLLPRNYELPWKKEREEGRREELSKNIPPPLPRSWKFTRHNDNYLPCFVTPRFPSLLGARLTKEERFLASWLPPPPPPPPSFFSFLSLGREQSVKIRWRHARRPRIFSSRTTCARRAFKKG